MYSIQGRNHALKVIRWAYGDVCMLWPLYHLYIQNLQQESEVDQIWFADDSAAVKEMQIGCVDGGM